jgi:LCP family protein required for cell wall assembly
LVSINFSWLKNAVELLKNNTLAVKRLLLVAGCITGVALFLAVGVTAVMLALDDSGRPTPQGPTEDFPSNEEYNGFITTIDTERPEDDDDGSLFRPPARTNFMLVGLDNGLLADAVMVGTFYRDSGNIHLMSVPRDMLVRIPAHRLDRMRADGFSPPRALKLTEMRGHGGRMMGIYYLQEQVEEMLGVDFDFFVEVELAAFRRIVDAIDGVYMYIPRRLVYNCYNDPPIRINVPAGYQRLNGHMAEGVVRYRQWPMGDLQRNEMQMQFMTALIQQATTREALLHDPMEIIRTLIDHVRTDMGLLDVARYLPFIPNVNADSIRTFTMPGDLRDIESLPNRVRNYFVPNTTQLPAVISEVFFYTPEAEAQNTVESEE